MTKEQELTSQSIISASIVHVRVGFARPASCLFRSHAGSPEVAGGAAGVGVSAAAPDRAFKIVAASLGDGDQPTLRGCLIVTVLNAARNERRALT